MAVSNRCSGWILYRTPRQVPRLARARWRRACYAQGCAPMWNHLLRKTFSSPSTLRPAIASLFLVSSGSRSTLAQERVRRPIPEALLTESTTDIDAEEAGELEFEANVAKSAARTGGARATLTSLEVEW